MSSPNVKLGKLIRIDLRAIWDDEARSFTPWLAREDNIKLLGDSIGIELEVDSIEVSVGSFKADIVCRATDDGVAIIENQLDKTNHDHLGKIITYASGLNAKYIIWVCSKATDEHRRAVDWLNETSIDGINYFLLEIELWKVGDSDPAPKFNVVCSPNEWAKVIVAPQPTSSTKQEHLEFWSRLKEYMTSHKSSLNLRTPRPQHWYSFAVGRSKFNLSLTRNTNNNRLGCEIYIRGSQAKEAFTQLKAQKDEIEKQLGALDWQELPEKQDCRIIQYRDADVGDREHWDEHFAWLQEKAEGFHRAFADRIARLKL